MKNNRAFFLALFLLLSSSCKTSVTTNPIPQPNVSPSPKVALPPNSTASAEGGTLNIVTLKCDDTCLDSEIAELPEIQSKINVTLNSKCLTDYFKNAKRLDYTNNLNADQILAKLRIPTTLTLNYYSQRFSRALGYESADDFTVIHFNRAKVFNWSTCEKASLGAHEFSHTKAFYHKGNLAEPNYYSVPYWLNHAFDSKDDDSNNGGCCL